MRKGGIGGGHIGGHARIGGHHHIGGHAHIGGHHHFGMHNRHMFHHSSYHRGMNSYGARPGPNIIMIAGLGAAGGMWIPRHRTFKSEMRIWIELEDN